MSFVAAMLLQRSDFGCVWICHGVSTRAQRECVGSDVVQTGSNVASAISWCGILVVRNVSDLLSFTLFPFRQLLLLKSKSLNDILQNRV